MSVSATALHWGTNTLCTSQSVDVAGNLSTPMHYDFYVQQSTAGGYTPGTAGDLNGDNKPDLVSVDAAGAVHIFSNPEVNSGDPNGDLTKDPLQYGGWVIIPASTNARWPVPDRASAAGALLAHAGSFTGNNYDDLMLIQNGFLAVATNPGDQTSHWGFATTFVHKPACATCVDYNGDDWSSVLQLVAVPTNPGQAPTC